MYYGDSAFPFQMLGSKAGLGRRFSAGTWCEAQVKDDHTSLPIGLHGPGWLAISAY